MINEETIKADLINLGLKQGDIIFIAADLLRVGFFKKNRDSTLSAWLDILLDVVGSEGTLVIPAYTKSFYRFKKNKSIIFTKNTEPDSGALSSAFFRNKNVIRSSHPTNSCFAIGKWANFILSGHDENSYSYLPYHKVIELGGKNLMIGAFSDSRLAPMAMHAAQESLGITEKRWNSGLKQSYYFDNEGFIKLFTRNDVGGCTGGGYKTYGHHIICNSIKFGLVGNGLSAYIDCSKSYKIFENLYKNNHRILRCDNTECPCCYGSPMYLHPYFWFKKIIKLFTFFYYAKPFNIK